MANTSILAAFERMWQHVVAIVGSKADLDHTHEEYATSVALDNLESEVSSSISNITNGSVVVANATNAVNAQTAAEATHAVSADSATTATTATTAGSAEKATQDASGNVITETYETKEDASAKLDEAKGYTDEKIAAIPTPDVSGQIGTHNTATDAHNDIRVLINDLRTMLTNFLDVDDETKDQLSEVITLIENNKGTLESITTSKINVSDIIDNLTTNVSNKPLSSAQGVVLNGLINALETELNSHVNDATMHTDENRVRSSEYIVDTEASYIKDIPADAAKPAKLNKLGGMTYKVNTGTEEEPAYELRSAPVTEIESVGVNLFDDTTLLNLGFTKVAEHEYFINNFWELVINKKVMFVNTARVSGSFTISCEMFYKDDGSTYSGLVANVFYTDGTNQFYSASNRTYGEYFEYIATTNANKTVDYIGFSYGSYTVGTTIKNMQIEYGSIATEYKPYTKHTLPIPEAVQALDGYGDGISESVYNYVDWEKKQFVKRVGKVDLGTIDWKTESTGLNYTYYSAVPNMFLPVSGSGRTSGFICSKYSPSKTTSDYTALDDKSMIRHTSGRYYLRDSACSDVATLKTALSGVMLCYELAEPVITDISGLLIDNLIPVEGGGILTFKNEHEYAVPNEVAYYNNNVPRLSATEFIGDLIGTSQNAIYDTDGNNIAEKFRTLSESVEINSEEETINGNEYIKDVPSDSASYAKVNMIGGMTRKCANLFDLGSAEFVSGYGAEAAVANGTLTVTGYFVSVFMYLSKGTYKLSMKSSRTSEYGGGVYVNMFDLDNNSIKTINRSNVLNPEVTIDVEIDMARIQLMLYGSGGPSDTTSSSTYSEIMLNQGDTALPYEPHFSGLRSAPVTEIESVGVNLIPEFTGSSKNGVTIAVDENGVITLDGNCTASGNISMNCPTIPKGKYCFSDSAQGTFPDNGQSRTQLMFSDGSIFSIGNNNTSSTALAFEINEELSYSLRIRVESGHTYSNCKLYPMLNRGTEALPYKPYVRNTLPIPSAVQALDGYGEGISESVYNYVDFDKKQFVRNVGKVVFDGTESWYNPNTEGIFQARFTLKSSTISSVNVEESLVSNGYRVRADYSANNKPYFRIIPNSKYIWIETTLEQFADLVAWKEYLSGNPVTIYYPIQSEITDISDILTDNTIQVEAGGTLTFVNEYEYSVPNDVTCYDNNYDRIASTEFVGNLIGTATMAEKAKTAEKADSAIFDGDGNKINMGSDDISGVGDGTVKGAIKHIASGAQEIESADISYVKPVLDNSANYAKVNKLGGMTRKCTNLIKTKETTETKNGITCTFSSDGVVVDGTATESVTFVIDELTVHSGQSYSLSGCPTNGSSDTYFLRVIDKATQGIAYLTDIGQGDSYTSSTEEVVRVVCRIISGTTVSNLTFKPMLNEGDTALPYEPYFEGLRSAPVTEIESVGANLIPYPYWGIKDNTITKNGITYTVNEDRSISVVGTCTATHNLTLWYDDTFDKIGITDGETVFINTNNKHCAVYDVTTKQTYINEAFVVDISHIYRIRINVGEGETLNETVYIMLNKGTEALSYKPYTHHTLSIPEAVQALEGYGVGISDTVYNYVDFEKKQFVQRVGKVDLGTIDWTKSGSGEEGSNLYVKTFNDIKVPTISGERRTGFLCAKYNPAKNITIATIENKAIMRYTESRVYIRDDDYTDAETFKAAMSGVMLYYELAEPVITDISNLLTDNLITVEEDGTLTFKNEHEYEVPNDIIFYSVNYEKLSSKEFIGNLTGTATKAVCDEKGRNIAETLGKTLQIVSFNKETGELITKSVD